MSRDKRRIRKIKKDFKRLGNKHNRRKMKRQLEENPDDAHLTDHDLGAWRSESFNGMDYDATRKRKGPLHPPDIVEPPPQDEI
jgi:hypothetical protein